MRIRTSRMAAVALVTALSLAGCGGSDSDSDSSKPKESASTSTTPDATDSSDAPTEAADGDAIKGDGYTFAAPKGWEVPSTAIPGTEVADTFVADLTDKDGFSDNINIIKQDTAPPKPITELKDDLGTQLTQSGGKDVKIKENGNIDGEESVHISSSQAANLTEQYFVTHDGATYFITFSHSPDVSEGERNKIAQSVLATWKWAS